jgi:hypothetical protein
LLDAERLVSPKRVSPSSAAGDKEDVEDAEEDDEVDEELVDAASEPLPQAARSIAAANPNEAAKRSARAPPRVIAAPQ